MLYRKGGMHMTENTYGNFTVINRKSIDISGVESLDSFDEYSINLSVKDSVLTVEGENLSITTLDLERGKVLAEGKINGIYYSDSKAPSGNGMFSKIFGKNR